VRLHPFSSSGDSAGSRCAKEFDQETAIEVAIKHFEIKDPEQQRRLDRAAQ
jgi:hypothetical protein